MTEKVLGLNKEMLLENMQWQHERLKAGKRITSAEHELSEWIERIQNGKFDVPVVSLAEYNKLKEENKQNWRAWKGAKAERNELKKKSVSLAWLEKCLKEEIKKVDKSLKQNLVDLRETYLVAKKHILKDLLCAARREAEKNG